jgi:hypothetical protein
VGQVVDQRLGEHVGVVGDDERAGPQRRLDDLEHRQVERAPAVEEQQAHADPARRWLRDRIREVI